MATVLSTVPAPAPVSDQDLASPSPDAMPIRLELGAVGINCRVWIGDTEVTRMCRSISVKADVDDIARVHLELMATKGVTITGTAGNVDAKIQDLATIDHCTGEPVTIVAKSITKVGG